MENVAERPDVEDTKMRKIRSGNIKVVAAIDDIVSTRFVTLAQCTTVVRLYWRYDYSENLESKSNISVDCPVRPSLRVDTMPNITFAYQDLHSRIHNGNARRVRA